MAFGRINRNKACRCLSCSVPIDAAMGVREGRGPQPGDVTICIECGHIMAFAHDLTMRILTDKEMLAVAGDRDIIRAQRQIAETKRRK